MPDTAQPVLVRSLARGLEMLSLLADAEDGLRLGELASAMGLKLPTAHNLLRTLSFHGFVEKTSRPVRYRLGPAVAQLAGLSAQRGLFRQAEKTMLRLATSMPGATISWAELCGEDVLQTMRVAPEGRPQALRLRGQALNPYGSASGLAFQAFAAPGRVEAFRRQHPFWEEASALWAAPERLEHFLVEVRARGCVVVHFPGETLCKAAAPVRDSHGELAGLLGVSYPAADVAAATSERRTRRLIEAAEELSNTGDDAC